MAQKKDNLPMNVDMDLQNGGSITYANEVIAIIAGVAANEIDGIAGMCVTGGFGDILGRNRNVTRGVKVELGSEEASVDLYIIVEYGKPIQKVSCEVQENVRKAIESMTGLHVVRVDVHVQGVSFEKEKKENQTSLEAAKNPALAEPEKKTEPAKEPEAEASTPASAKNGETFFSEDVSAADVENATEEVIREENAQIAQEDDCMAEDNADVLEEEKALDDFSDAPAQDEKTETEKKETPKAKNKRTPRKRA